MTERALRPSGFTLLELTLALASLALLAAICYGAFHLSWRAVQRGEAAVVTAQRLRVAIDVFIRQIKSVAVYEVPTEDDEPVSYFYGEPTWMKFVTTAGLAQGGGLTRVVYRLEDDPPRLVVDETHVFTRRSLGAEGRAEPPVSEHSAILLDGFKDLRFAYLPKEENAPAGEGGWQSEWIASDEGLPAAVRIIVRGMPGIEADEWGHEVPIMSTAVGDNDGAPDENNVQEPGGEGGTEEEGGGEGPPDDE